MKTAIALGTFDGLHKGHRAVLAKAQDFYSIAVTFEIPPKGVIGGVHQLLMLPEDRIKRIKELGINQVDVQKFEDVCHIAATDYLKNLKEKYNPSRIVCGFNYRFGKDALGDTELLAEFCEKNNIEFCCVPPELDGESVISSTNLREHIKSGDVKKASECIYGGFSFSAPVLHGDARGRTIGFPTANQDYPELLVVPKHGVYISRITVDGRQYRAITNIGVRPTFKTENIGCETYIKDFSGDIYGKTLKTELLNFVRKEKKFNTLTELKNAIKNDIELLD